MDTQDRNMAHAQMLFAQGRYDLAKGPLREALASDPDNGEACSLLAWCHLQEDDYVPATDLAQRAISLDPDCAFFHFVLGGVYLDRDMPKEALREAQEALRLDPADADNWRLLSGVHAHLKRWPEALEAAERGLAIDGEHDGCTHMRVVALRGLGRHGEAAEAARGTLEREPDSPVAHANAGWTCLHRGQIRQAKVHFREALRLDPGLDWARQGLLEAIKATNPVYRLFLAYMLWMSARSTAVQWAVIIVGWLGYRFARTAIKNDPSLKPVLLPVIVLYLAFVLLTWFAMPVFNLMLFVHPLGRHALRRDDRTWATAFGATLAAAAGLWIAHLATGLDVWFVPALTVSFLLAPVAAAGLCRPGRPRLIMTAYLGGLVFVGGLINAGAIAGFGAASLLLPVLVLGCVFAMLGTNIVNSTPAGPKS